MRAALLVLSVASMVVAGACAAAPADEPADPAVPASGVRGVVVAGPQCPVVVQGSPCPDRPWRGTVRLTNTQGDLVAEVTTDAAGRFDAPVRPGSYTVRAAPDPGGMGGADERTVTVPDRGGWVHVVLTVDTGIR